MPSMLIGSRRALLASLLWTPADLGAALKLSIDPQNLASLDASAVSSGVVSSITDTAGARAFTQAVTGSKPATLLDAKGRRIIRPDGTDDSLRSAAALGITLNSCDIWLAGDQRALVADASEQHIVGLGGVTSTTGGRISRRVVSGVNRARFLWATAGGGGAAENLNVDFSGPYVLRVKAWGTSGDIEVNGISAGAVGTDMSFTDGYMTLFASQAASPANFAKTDLKYMAVTTPLTGADETRMYAFCNRRIA